MHFFDLFYIPHYNSCPIGAINGWPVYFFFYLFLLISLLLFVIFSRLILKSAPAQAKSGLIKVVWGAVIMIILFQTIGQIRYFHKEYTAYHKRPVEDRYNNSLFKECYNFSSYCKKILPGKHDARLLTDLDLSQEIPGLFTKWTLGYFLWPIDVRDVRKNSVNPKPVLITFRKQNPRKSIPDNYKIIGKWNDNLIAVRKGDAWAQ